MDALYSSLTQLEGKLRCAGLSWAVIGGVAVAVWGEPRLTRDVDVKISVARDDLQTLLDALGASYQPVHGAPKDTVAAMGIVFVEDGAGTKIDLMLADLPFDRQMIERARQVQLDPVTRPMVCTAEDLIIYKLLSSRPRDYDDAASVVRRQGARLDRRYILNWLEQFEAALDDSTLVSAFRSMRTKPG